MKKKRLRRALINSIMSLTLCCAMLIGTTYAWMVDSVRSTNNRIAAGNAVTQILTYSVADSGERIYRDISSENGDLFAGTSWEPGTARYVNLAVRNKGNIDLKYEVGLIIRDAGLAELLEYSIVDVDEAIRVYGLSFEEIEEELYGEPEKEENAAVYSLSGARPSDEDDKDDEEENIRFEDLVQWEPLEVDSEPSVQTFSLRGDSEETGEEAEQEETGAGTVSYMVITEEKTISVLDESDVSAASLEDTGDEPETDPRLNHYVLSVRMKDMFTKEDVERFRNAQCEIDICIVATQNMNEGSGDGEDEGTGIIIPTPALENHIYHFTTVDVVPEEKDDTEGNTETAAPEVDPNGADTEGTTAESDEDADTEYAENTGAYVTYEPVRVSSLSENIQIELPEGMLVDDGVNTEEETQQLVISVSPGSMMDELVFDESKLEQTLNVQIHGLSEENEIPFTLTQYIGEDNRLTKIIFTETVDESDMSEEKRETVIYDAADTENVYETDSETRSIEAEYDKETGFGFEYDPANGNVVIYSTHTGSYTLVWEPAETEDI